MKKGTGKAEKKQESRELETRCYEQCAAGSGHEQYWCYTSGGQGYSILDVRVAGCISW